MAAGLECNVEGCPLEWFPAGCQCDKLSVRATMALVIPSASMSSPRAITQPTIGLGSTWPSPARASSRARCIQ